MPEILPQELTEEEKELQELRRKVVRFPKLHQWLNLYFDKENIYQQTTYLDGTKAAKIAYNIPEGNEQYAWEIASKNTSKCKVWAQRYYAVKGLNKEKVLDLIGALAVEGKPKALEILASIMDVYQPRAQQIAIQNNTQNNFTAVQVTPEKVQQYKQEFTDFINHKYQKTPAPELLAAPPSPTEQPQP